MDTLKGLKGLSARESRALRIELALWHPQPDHQRYCDYDMYYDEDGYDAACEEMAEQRHEYVEDRLADYVPPGADELNQLDELAILATLSDRRKQAEHDQNAVISYLGRYGGYSDVKLSDIVGVSRSTVNRIRNDDENVRRAQKIATEVCAADVEDASAATRAAIAAIESSTADVEHKLRLTVALLSADNV